MAASDAAGSEPGSRQDAVRVFEIGPERAEQAADIIHEAFASRPAVDPPAPALGETADTVRAALEAHTGLMAAVNGTPVGVVLLRPDTVPWGESLLLRRVSVLPSAQHQGVAQALAAAAEDVARRLGLARAHLTARLELPATVRFWERNGYREKARDGTLLTMAKEMPLVCVVETAGAMRLLGERLAGALWPGDVLLLSGDLGAGKTTLTQGIGAGLGVRGDVTSPTFVISRVHPSLVGGPSLVHVDAYRLAGLEELDDLDLEVSLEDSVTVVEWGGGIAEALADDRLEVTIARPLDAGDETRRVWLTPVGARWVGSGVTKAVT